MRRALLCLHVALSGCIGTAGEPRVTRTAPEDILGAELAALGDSVDPRTSVARSRLLRALGRQADALVALEAATDGARERLDWPGLASLLREEGDVHLEMGRPQAALGAYGKRLKIAVSTSNQATRASALVDTAYAFALMGAMSRADAALSEARLLAGRSLDPEATERTALTRERLNDSDQAVQLLVAAGRAYEQRGDPTGAARTAVLAAQLRARAGRPEALDPLDEIVGRSLDPDPQVRLLRFRAEAAYRARAMARCEELARSAVGLADRRGLQHESKLARIALARCAGALGHVEPAIEAAEEAAELAEEQRQHLTGEHARLEVGFEAFLIYRLLLSLQVRLPDVRRAADAFETMERARARAHLDAAARGQANLSEPIGEVSPLLLQSRAEAEDRVRRLTQELAAGRTDAAAERHRNALWALEDIEEEIARGDPLLSRLRLPRPATIAEVQDELLDDGTLLVSYLFGEEQVVAIAIARGKARLAVLPRGAERIAAALEAFRTDVLLAPDGDPLEARAAARALYGDLLGPFDQLVSSHRRLLIIPHGPLSSLPFEALIDRRGKYLVEGHDVSYSLSATLGLELARGRERARTPRLRFAGLGDPVYDWAGFEAERAETGEARSRGLALWSRAGGGARLGLQRLPGTGEELRAIARLFGGDQKIYLRAEASEENVKAGALSDARLVHIASHGLLAPHYQALALTLRPDAREDGFLLGREIAGLKLAADLVVLSACDTGTTRLRAGEPIAGLALALRNAGARRVVVSLWAVDDQATARLMTDFYRPLAGSNTDYAAALADAKRKMLAAGPQQPYFWAPFVLLGD